MGQHNGSIGYLWQEGYESGAYNTPLFDDVLPQLQKWHEKGLGLSIYSSGSVFAQKLLFGHVKDGGSSIDRCGLITSWFDTVNAGPKTHTDSYEKIVRSMGKDVGQVLFLSDNVKEIQAATEAGMKAIVIEREGNSPLKQEDRTVYQVVTSLDQIEL